MKQIQEDKIISEFLKSLGPWREFVVIGGGFALFIYNLSFWRRNGQGFNLIAGIGFLAIEKIPWELHLIRNDGA